MTSFLRNSDNVKARFWGLLAIGLAVTALPVAAGITIARDVFRKLAHYDQTGAW